MSSSASDIRQQFISFFEDRCGHTFAPSSSVVPHDDPTLLFTNAGMNQFKDVFLGRGNRAFVRAVNSQKCIRAGGKHNDLEDVGTDTYHHTFFEMLGNWSFGDYFKAEAIEWAWEFLTEVCGLDKSRLHVTVFEGDQADSLDADEETVRLWLEKTDIDPSHVTRWGRKDNFWEMGDTGPCGPCSEIHYDCTPEGDGGHLVNRDHPDVIEIWNLVFIQFNRDESGSLHPLPAKHVDTGMGFERLVRVMQSKSSNYDTDLWTPLFASIEIHTGARPYSGIDDDQVDIAYRVLADHIRCLCIALTDGARPGAAGREYVLRRILRRAVRHAHQTLGVEGTVLWKLVPAVVDSLGGAFPELAKNPDHVAEIIRDEEESFLRTLDRGIALFEQAAEGSNCIDAEAAFALHDTFGFPIDLTEVMADEQGITVDRAGYERLMEQARTRSRATSDGDARMHLPATVLSQLLNLHVRPTEDDAKYGDGIGAGNVVAIWNGRDLVDTADATGPYGIILDATCFYAEAGGQIGDTGHMLSTRHLGYEPKLGMPGRRDTGDAEFKVAETHRHGDFVMHVGHVVDEPINCSDKVSLHVDAPRRSAIRANHTSTHLMNHALRAILGDEVQQKGSLVADDRLRFDYAHAHPMTDGEIEEVERLVNAAIDADLIVHAADVPLALAQSITGVRAVFGERYPDPVRVVSVGASVEDLIADPGNARWMDHSIEFCGGTHLKNCDSANHFVLIHEQALAAGTRRITALTGVAAATAREAGEDLLTRIAAAGELGDAELPGAFDELNRLVDEMHISQPVRHRARAALDSLRARVKKARKAAASDRRGDVLEQARSLIEGDEQIVVAAIEGGDKETLLTALDTVRAKRPGGAVMLLSADQDAGKVIIVAGVDPPLIEKGLKAGDWVKEAAKACGGGGGGRPDTAQAGGKDPAKMPQAMKAAQQYALEATT